MKAKKERLVRVGKEEEEGGKIERFQKGSNLEGGIFDPCT